MQNQMKARLYYDAEAEVYDANRYGSVRGRRVDLFQKRLVKEALLSELSTGGRVLEVGCGTGRFIEYMAESGHNASAVDISEGMLSVAKRRLEGRGLNANLQQSSAESLPFEDASFDGVLSILVLNLVPDIEQVFREVKRVLRPRGVFFFSVPNLRSVYFPIGLYVNARGLTVSRNAVGHRPSKWFTRPTLEAQLCRAGFTLSRVWGQPLHVRHVDDCRPFDGRGLPGLLSRSLYLKAIRN